MRNLKPSEVRKLMLRDLEGLRSSLDRVAEAARSDVGLLRESIVDLHRRLRRYLDHEDAWLLPALEATDHGGPERLQWMRSEHAAHWTAVEDLALAATYVEVDLVDLARRAGGLRCELSRDLDDEERCLLIAEVLQEGVSCMDQSDG